MSRRKKIRDKILRNVVLFAGELDTPCWLWTGATSGNGRGGGYARMNLDGATVAVHKAAWINEHGMIPPKKQLDHLCHLRLCVREDHLELVTHKENQRRRDRKRKARQVEVLTVRQRY